MCHHQPKPCNCCSDLALAGALALVALSGFSIALGIVTTETPHPTWLALWCNLPAWIKFVPASLVGLTISVIVAGPVVRRFNKCLKDQLPRHFEERDNERVAPWLTGMIERFAFTFVVMAYPGGAAAGMFGWLGLKMAANWNKDAITTISEEDDRKAARFEKLTWNRHAFLGLLTGFISMCFAWVGGVVARLILGLAITS